MAKKKTGAKSAKGPKKKAISASPRASQKDVDPESLDTNKARSRLGAIYSLEKELENKRVAFSISSSNRRVAKAELDEAEEALAKEIREQRTGPGPLFGEDREEPEEPGDDSQAWKEVGN